MEILHAMIFAGSDVLAAVPNPGPAQAPPGVGGKFEDVMGMVKWIALGLAIIAFMIVGAVMLFGGGRGQGGEHGGRLGWAAGGTLIISSAAALVGFLVA